MNRDQPAGYHQIMRHLIAGIALLGATLPASAQVAVVDEGSFTITQNGTRIGREEFAIRRTPSPGGDVLVANATVVYTDRRLSPALQTDAAGAPLRYQVEVSVGADIQERLQGRVGRGRFSAQLRTPRGESSREYVVADGALILDDDVFHQYYFLARAGRTGTVPVVVPRRNVQLSMRVNDEGADMVMIGGSRVAATRYAMSDPDGGTRRIWVDAQGRVLKVTLEGRGITATRDDPPR
ncbi:MAG TPA: DUF6134 family protein [Gemmatimonadaceae bacterium]|nr:DUF6134 family protein [Gemmatimonadaceae bacterium]